MDNPKLKKLDSKKVAISQKHEMEYCRKIAKEILSRGIDIEIISKDEDARLSPRSISGIKNLQKKVYIDIGGGDLLLLTRLSTINRLAKAFLKLTEREMKFKRRYENGAECPGCGVWLRTLNPGEKCAVCDPGKNRRKIRGQRAQVGLEVFQ